MALTLRAKDRDPSGRRPSERGAKGPAANRAPDVSNLTGRSAAVGPDFLWARQSLCMNPIDRWEKIPSAPRGGFVTILRPVRATENAPVLGSFGLSAGWLPD